MLRNVKHAVELLALVTFAGLAAAANEGAKPSGHVTPSVDKHVMHHDAEAIKKAQLGMEKEIPVANGDLTRPVYHFLPEARWINDPDGAFYANGWYHVFYQFNPYGNGWGHMHWGHVRSRDNVTWERLPIAVWPDNDKGEDHCYSGSAVQDGEGKWQLWYTSVSKVRSKDQAKGRLDWVFNGQVMLKPMDKDFIKWGKSTDDPVNKPNLPNNIDGYPWNKYLLDPTFFKVNGRTFMLLGIIGVFVSLYALLNPDMTVLLMGILLGVMILMMGIMQLGFSSGFIQDRVSWLFLIIGGMLSIVVGFYLILYPQDGMKLLIVFIGCYLIAYGVIGVIRGRSSQRYIY